MRRHLYLVSLSLSLLALLLSISTYLGMICKYLQDTLRCIVRAKNREREKVRNDFIYAAVSPGSWHNGLAGHGIMSVNICILVGVDRQRYRER